MPKMNCWEIKKCGRELGGERAEELGVCAASTFVKGDGINGGTNGGRACWAVKCCSCRKEMDGSFSSKVSHCFACSFFKRVQKEEGETFYSASDILYGE